MSDEMMMTAGKSIIWEVPFWYADPKEPLAEEYIRRKLDREKMILRSKSDSKIADTEDTEYNITPHFDFEKAREMVDSGLIEIQSHTYDFHQWAPYENGEKVKLNN